MKVKNSMSSKQTNTDEASFYIDNLLFNHDIEILSQFVRDLSFERKIVTPFTERISKEKPIFHLI